MKLVITLPAAYAAAIQARLAPNATIAGHIAGLVRQDVLQASHHVMSQLQAGVEVADMPEEPAKE